MNLETRADTPRLAAPNEPTSRAVSARSPIPSPRPPAAASARTGLITAASALTGIVTDPREYVDSPILTGSIVGSDSVTVGTSVTVTPDKTLTTSIDTYTFASPIEIDSSKTWFVRVVYNDGATNVEGGVYAGIDAYSINGSVVPEPSSLALLAMGGLCLARRRGGVNSRATITA